MTRLILHVGPPKCGSTSIQHFFANQKKPCVENTYYKTLAPLEISELNREEPSESILTMLTQLFVDKLTRSDVLILSHEYLFECHYAINNICSLAKDLVTEIFVVGYSRKQSEFLISAYSQWGFRLPYRIKEAAVVFDELELDSVLFSGLEQQLITSIANDFYVADYGKYRILDWYNSYKEITQLIHESGAVIKCGVLPSKESDNTLIQDFCEKSGLTLRDEMKAASQQILNTSFNPDVIEAMNNAVAFGLDMPGPHESNDVLELLSNNMVKMTNQLSEFLFNLKSYIDTYFLGLNQQYCREYGLSETYFTPAARFNKREILDLIIQEDQQRTLNNSVVINNYRMLSAKMIELCLQLTKEGGSGSRKDNLPAQLNLKRKVANIWRALTNYFKH